MENRIIDKNPEEQKRYKNAQERVKELRGFYSHLITYIAVNVVLIIFNILYNELGYMKIKVNQFYTIIIWGIILLLHAFYVLFLGKNWEHRKINNLINKDKNQH